MDATATANLLGLDLEEDSPDVSDADFELSKWTSNEKDLADSMRGLTSAPKSVTLRRKKGILLCRVVCDDESVTFFSIEWLRKGTKK